MREKFEKYVNFVYGDTTGSSVENRIFNVAGTEWPSFIANLGEDIGFYKIEIPWSWSHSITGLVRYVSFEAKESELVPVDVRKRNEIDSDRPYR